MLLQRLAALELAKRDLLPVSKETSICVSTHAFHGAFELAFSLYFDRPPHLLRYD